MTLKNPKAKGARQERRTMAWLEKRGALFTIKAGGSLGMWDVIALFKDRVELVQVKSNRPPQPKEMEVLINFPPLPYASKWTHVWKDHAREPLVEEVE